MKDTGNEILNLWQGIKFRLKSMTENPRRKAGLTRLKEIALKHRPNNMKLRRYNFGDNVVFFHNGVDLLHSLDELFVKEIYQQSFDNPYPYIIDCGSNIGLSVLYAKLKCPGAIIEAFEPDERNFSLLQRNVGHFSSVSLNKKAVWKEKTKLEFLSEGTLGSRVVEHSTGNHILVEAIRLRDLLIKQVDFLKIDIEGAEYEVLMDCDDSLKLVKNLFIEYHGSFSQCHQLNEILALVCKNGFSYYIKEAAEVYKTPFARVESSVFDIQLNIFCFRV